jgi:sigma-E factor negative regulatory protein RseA
MSEQLRESLSAAMDGEADAFELRRVLDEATQDESLREQWHRLHLMRDVLRDDLKVYQPGLRDYVWLGLDAEDQPQDDVAELVLANAPTGGKPLRSPWVGRLTGTAVAATVALAVMFNGGLFDDYEDGAAPTVAGANERAAAQFSSGEFAAGSNQAATGAELANNLGLEPVLYTEATARDQQRQNALMLHHIQQRAMNQAGVASFVKMATFNSTRSTPARSVMTAEERPAP